MAIDDNGSFIRKLLYNFENQDNTARNDDTERKDLIKEFNKKENEEDKKRLEKILERAYGIRQFEIDMYWKRAGYFWVFIGVMFAGYFVLISKKGEVNNGDEMAVIRFLAVCMGVVFSFAWVLVNAGSRYWMEHWEQVVDVLEDVLGCPLYRINSKSSLNPWNKRQSHFKVWKINKLIGIVVFVVWFGLGVFECWGMLYCCFCFKCYIDGYVICYWVIMGITLLVIGILFCWTYRKNKEDEGRFYDRGYDVFKD